MNAPATAVIANSSGIAVGTRARNRIKSTTNAATIPMISLPLLDTGAFSASPVNCVSIPAFWQIDRSVFSRSRSPGAGS